MVRLFDLEVLLLKIYPTETFVHIGKDMHKGCLLQLICSPIEEWIGKLQYNGRV